MTVMRARAPVDHVEPAAYRQAGEEQRDAGSTH